MFLISGTSSEIRVGFGLSFWQFEFLILVVLSLIVSSECNPAIPSTFLGWNCRRFLDQEHSLLLYKEQPSWWYAFETFLKPNLKLSSI